MILDGPVHKCHSCEKLCCGRLGAMYSWDVASEQLKMVNESVKECVVSVWFCNKCKNALQGKKVPSESQFNRMKVAEIPSVLIGLNTLEQQLISKATVLMKMVIMPRGGQRTVRRQVINFPSNVDSVVSQLPRLPNGENIVYVQMPESGGSESNGTDQETLYHSCRYSRIMEALQSLKRHNPLYSDVTVTKMAEDMVNDDGDNTAVAETENNVDEKEKDLEMDETGIVRLDALHANVMAVKLLEQNSSPLNTRYITYRS